MMIYVNGQPLAEYSFHQKPSKRFVFDDMEMEEREAARFCGYTWQEYLALPGCDRWINPENASDSKSSVIAYYRAKSHMDSVAHDFPPPKTKGR